MNNAEIVIMPEFSLDFYINYLVGAIFYTKDKIHKNLIVPS